MKPRATPRIPPASSADTGRAADPSAPAAKSASPKYRQDNRPRVETDLLIAGIRKTIQKAAQTSSKDDCIAMLITACIEQGFDIGPRITGIARALGFNAQHTDIILKRGTGTAPGPQPWLKDQQGRYRLMPA
jgi:hypothetical protein